MRFRKTLIFTCSETEVLVLFVMLALTKYFCSKGEHSNKRSRRVTFSSKKRPVCGAMTYLTWEVLFRISSSLGSPILVKKCGVYIYIYIPRTQLMAIFEGQPSKTRPFQIKTRGPIWLLGMYSLRIQIPPKNRIDGLNPIPRIGL